MLLYIQYQNQLLNNIFNDPKTGFIGAEKLLRRAKLINPNITMKQVKAFLNDNPINQVFQKPTKSKIDAKDSWNDWPLPSRFNLSH